jgi:hypothetical protein
MIISLLENLLTRAFNSTANNLHHRRQAKNNTKGSNNSESETIGLPLIIADTIASARERTPSIPIELLPETRKRGFFVTGQTGSGKSVFALQMATWDILNDNALINIDYRGESTDKLLAFLAARFTPEQLAERLILLDVRQRSAYGAPNEPVVGFNPLQEIGDDPHATVAQFLDVLRQTWGESALGVQLIDTLRHVLLALRLSKSGTYTLLDIEPLLMDVSFRATVLVGVDEETVVRFFQRFDALPDQSSWVLPVLNKLSPLLATHRRLRAMLGVREGGISFRALLEEKPNAIILICLGADETAKAVAGVVGSLLLTAAIRGVMRSDRTLPTGDHGTHFLLDEFLNHWMN